MGLFDDGMLGGGGLQELAGDLGKPQEAARDDSYPAHYNPSRFDSFGGELTEGKAVEIARDTVPAGIERRWGFGRAQNPQNQGFQYGIFQNASGEQIQGVLIYQWENSTGRETQVVHEEQTNDMDTADRYDRDTQPPLPEQRDKNRAAQDEALVVLFEATTPAGDITNAYEIDAGASECRLPATEYDVS
jgi:hypothetical protein